MSQGLNEMATIEIKVPDIGDVKDVAVIELLVQPGDTVKAEQSLITVESDKASMEIPSSHAGARVAPMCWWPAMATASSAG